MMLSMIDFKYFYRLYLFNSKNNTKNICSGMLVQDPSSANDVDAIFNQAGQAGAVQRPIDHLPPSSSSRSFTGMGRLLSGETVSSTPQPPASITHNIIFWSNGFTVDDGPLRRLDDPENASFLEVISKPSIWDSGLILMILSLQDLAVEFAPRSTLSITCFQPELKFNCFTVGILPLVGCCILTVGYFLMQSIKKSEWPEEFEPADRRTAVNVNLVRKNEKFIEPEKPHPPFQGVGRTLGCSSSNPVGPDPTVPATPFNTAPAPSMGLVVDETLPLTSIQLRLADGTRMISRFNYHHTVRDIRNFIDASRSSGPRDYQLQTVGFPPKQLTDLDQTIEQAGLASSVVIQKF
ncbi:Plant UBX domain-containing protein 5 [Vitis vinifera]|uniref:Plant UBX domain-containing protein 5 n=1 Tax=Vitis vinifera TaxID=29760 RepID=A0A438IL11_VITVI|nr:Plant UBX domain-containing protein 5 [Vitis vinifera]